MTTWTDDEVGGTVWSDDEALAIASGLTVPGETFSLQGTSGNDRRLLAGEATINSTINRYCGVGYNIDADGSLSVDAADNTAFMLFEMDYDDGVGVRGMEWHVDMGAAGQSVKRPIQATYYLTGANQYLVDLLFQGRQFDVFGSTILHGAFQIGDASADTVDVQSAAWTLTNGITYTVPDDLAFKITGSDDIATFFHLINTDTGGKDFFIASTGPSASKGAGNLLIYNNTNSRYGFVITGLGSVLIGADAAIATNATDGFIYVPTCEGTPTGTPTAHSGLAPIVINTTNNKFYFYSGGAWRDAGP